MYIFQARLEEICRRRRLVFEKFLGDGAFYSSRRAMRMIAAACEIQRAYDDLRHGGFPFDQGIRMAVNYSTYRLLPMAKPETGPARFEFFGHGIVELARLTTGKSTREVDEIAEFLIHSGYDTGPVEEFLRPLAAARSGLRSAPGRTYSAWLDDHGEPKTLEQIGQQFGVSKERIRQLEARAITKLRGDFHGDARRLLGV